MNQLIKDYLESEGIVLDAMKLAQEPVQPVAVPQQPQVSPEEQLAQQLGQLLEAEPEADLGTTYGYYAVEPLLGAAGLLEDVTGGLISLDEEAALAFRNIAEQTRQDMPVAGNIAMLGGALTGLPGIGIAGRGVGAVAKRAGAGSRLQKAAEFGSTGGAYGFLIPELEEGEDSTTETVLGTGLGFALGLLTGGRVRPTSATNEVVIDLTDPDVTRVIEDILPALDNESVARIRNAQGTQGTGYDVPKITVNLDPTKASDFNSAIKVPKAPDVKPKTSIGRALQATAEGLDYIGGSLSTRIGVISPSMLKRMRQFEYEAKKNTSDLYGKVENLVTGISKIKGDDKALLSRALYNGDHDVAIEVLKRNDAKLLPEFYKAKSVLKTVRDDLVKSGYEKIGNVANYWPRLVKDYDGLLQAVGAEKKTAIERALADYATRKNIPVKQIPADERSNIIGQVLRGYKPTVTTSSGRFAKDRRIDSVDEDLLPFYATPEESLEFYLRSTSHNMAKNKLLGKHATKDNSAQSLLDELVQKGEISAEDAGKLVPLLQSRLIQGEMSPSGVVSAVRDIGYATTIANPLSAMVQLGDIAQSAILNDVRGAIASMLGRKNIKVDDVGLRDTIIQELNEGHKGLDKLFRISQFKRFDRLGKETFINSKFKSLNRQLGTEKGTANFRNEWSKFYGDETEALIADLRAGNLTDNVKFHLFNELSGVQPISLLEMPQAYLNSPNGRILYALKSFTLKQYDLLRREIVQRAKRGDVAGATKFAARYAVFMSVANGSIQTIRDMLTGQITSGDEAVEKFGDKLLFETLGALGFGRYLTERYLERGDIKGFITAQVSPATPLFDAAFKEVSDLLSENREFDLEPILKNVPVVGSTIPLMAIWYNFLFGGLEDYLEERDKANE